MAEDDQSIDSAGNADSARLERVAAALPGVRDAVDGSTLALDEPVLGDARDARDEVISRIEGHLLPRLADADAPMVVVVGGSTGSGKSTLVNSIAGLPITAVGAKRPTTTSPVIVCHPDDLAWFSERRILPGMARGAQAEGDAPASLSVAMSTALPPGLAVIDAPDIDSVAEANHALADELLRAADVWFWVTTPTRYGDRRPLEYLERAGGYGRPVAVLINKLEGTVRNKVVGLLNERLETAGLEGIPVFTADRGLTEDARLPDPVMTPIREWIEKAGDPESRRATIARSLDASLAGVDDALGRISAGLEAEQQAQGRLMEHVDQSYAAARRRVREALEDGSLLRGEVARQMPEALGTGKYMRQIEKTVEEVRRRALDTVSDGTRRRLTDIRDRLEIRNLMSGKDDEEDFDESADGEVTGSRDARTEKTVRRMGSAAAQSLTEVILAQATRAAGEAGSAWRGDPAAAAMLPQPVSRLSRASDDLREVAEAEIVEWRGDLVELVRDLGAPRLRTMKFLSGGINLLAAALMLVVFAGTGGALLGTEIAVAGGAAAAMHKMLVYVLGKQTVAQMASQARAKLDARVETLLAREQERFSDALTERVSPEGTAENIAEARAALVEAGR